MVYGMFIAHSFSCADKRYIEVFQRLIGNRVFLKTCFQ